MSTTEENPLQQIFTNFMQSNIDLINSLIADSQQKLATNIDNILGGITKRLENLEVSPKIKYTTTAGEFEVENGIIDLVATGFTQNKKSGYITYTTDVSVELPAGYLGIVVAPIELRTSKAYLVTNYVTNYKSISVIYKSIDRFIPFDVKEVVGKLIIVKNG